METVPWWQISRGDGMDDNINNNNNKSNKAHKPFYF